MAEKTVKELNDAAMQIILHAGNCRNLVNECLRSLEEPAKWENMEHQLQEAKAEITRAHRIQTDMIQSTIENEELETTLLFTHAQDTLMTIYSEYNIACHIIRLYKKLMGNCR